MKILVIRFKFIGDVLLSSTLCSTLKKSFPEAQVDFLIHENAAPIFERHHAIDNLITLNQSERKPLAYFKRIWALRKNKYDIIIDATSTNRSEFICAFAKSAKYRIGRYKKGRGWFYTHRINKFPGNKVQQRLAMLQPLIDGGYSIDRDEQIQITLSKNERDMAKSSLREAGVKLDQPIFAFSVSSKIDYRRWKKAHMKELVQHCLDRHRAQIILLQGMPHEQAYIDQFKEELGINPRVFSNVNTHTLRQLAALLSQCHIYIGTEGGSRHIAEAVGIPTVAVFSPAAEIDEWLPGKCSRHQGIEWRSVKPDLEGCSYSNGDDAYYELYNLIKPQHVIPLIDDVVERHLYIAAAC